MGFGWCVIANCGCFVSGGRRRFGFILIVSDINHMSRCRWPIRRVSREGVIIVDVIVFQRFLFLMRHSE